MILILLTAITLASQRVPRIPDNLLTAARSVPRLPTGFRAYLPEEVAYTYALRLPQASYRRISVHAKTELDERKGILLFMRERGLSEKAIRVLVTDFNEDEQAIAAHTAAAAESSANSSPGSADIYLYRADSTSRESIIAADRTSWADIDRTRAIDLFHGEGPAAILVKSGEAKPGRVIWQGNPWACYVNEDWPRPVQ